MNEDAKGYLGLLVDDSQSARHNEKSFPKVTFVVVFYHTNISLSMAYPIILFQIFYPADVVNSPVA